MKDIRLAAFGLTIRELRKAKGLSQEAFADAAGLDRSYMGHIERGEKNITLSKVYQIAGALNMTVSDIFLAVQANQEQ